MDGSLSEAGLPKRTFTCKINAVMSVYNVFIMKMGAEQMIRWGNSIIRIV